MTWCISSCRNHIMLLDSDKKGRYYIKNSSAASHCIIVEKGGGLRVNTWIHINVETKHWTEIFCLRPNWIQQDIEL